MALIPAFSLLLLSAFCQGSSHSQVAGDSAAPDRRSRERIIEVLRSLRDPDHAPVQELVLELRPLAAGHLDLLAQVLNNRQVPGSGQEPQVLSELQRSLVLRTIETLDPAKTGDFFLKPPSIPLTRASAIARVDLLGALGHRGQLDELFEIASRVWLGLPSDAPEQASLKRGERAALRSALHSIMRRDETAFDHFKHAWPSLHEQVRAELLFALGSSNRTQALEVLTVALRTRDSLSSAALGQVSKLAKLHRPSNMQSLYLNIRPFLGGSRAQASAACQALGSLAHMQAIPDLMQLLQHEHPQVSEAAHAALCSMTGQPFPMDASRWKHWHSMEQDWIWDSKPEVLRNLHSGDPRQVAGAARLLLQHPMAFDELDASIEKLMADRLSSIRLIAMQFAAQRRLLWALPAMIDAFGDPAPEISQGALAAACTLTGLNASIDSELWDAYVQENALAIESH